MVTYHQNASDVDKCKIHIKSGFLCNPFMFFKKYALRTEFRGIDQDLMMNFTSLNIDHVTQSFTVFASFYVSKYSTPKMIIEWSSNKSYNIHDYYLFECHQKSLKKVVICLKFSFNELLVLILEW